MMGKYQAYPEHKESGIEWIGAVPEQWRKVKVKFFLDSMVAGGTPDSSDEKYWTESGSGIPWVSIADLSICENIIATKKDITQLGVDAKGISSIPKGSILYSIFASLGKVGEAKVELTTNQAILGLTPNRCLEKQFLKYWLKSLEKYLCFFSSSNTQDNLNAEKVGNLPLILPSSEEQKAIGNFLDHETAKIDTLIEKQQQLIKLLKEKRQAVIRAFSNTECV